MFVACYKKMEDLDMTDTDYSYLERIVGSFRGNLATITMKLNAARETLRRTHELKWRDGDAIRVFEKTREDVRNSTRQIHCYDDVFLTFKTLSVFAQWLRIIAANYAEQSELRENAAKAIENYYQEARACVAL